MRSKGGVTRAEGEGCFRVICTDEIWESKMSGMNVSLTDFNSGSCLSNNKWAGVKRLPPYGPCERCNEWLLAQGSLVQRNTRTQNWVLQKQAHAQDLKTTNQPAPRNSHSFRRQELNSFRNVPNQTAPGNKQTAAAPSHEVSRNHPA